MKTKLKHQNMYIDILDILASSSTCKRLKVGALLLKDTRIIATAWNGVPSGKQHCEEYFKNYNSNSQDFLDLHKKWSDENELHAESNLISFSSKNGIETNGTTLLVSISPCIHCAKLIVSAGIKNVYYLEKYDRDKSGIHFLENNDIICEQIFKEDI